MSELKFKFYGICPNCNAILIATELGNHLCRKCGTKIERSLPEAIFLHYELKLADRENLIKRLVGALESIVPKTSIGAEIRDNALALAKKEIKE